MKRLVFVVGALIAAALMTDSAFATDHYTTIRLTANIGTHGQYKTKCIAIIETEIIGVSRKSNDVVHWVIQNGNSVDQSDACKGADEQLVELRFGRNPVFGAEILRNPVQEMINGITYWVIKGTINPKIREGHYKYRVWYPKKVASNPNDKDPAGPDPDVEVDCTGCAPP
jgi:hypothetical protein